MKGRNTSSTKSPRRTSEVSLLQRPCLFRSARNSDAMFAIALGTSFPFLPLCRFGGNSAIRPRRFARRTRRSCPFSRAVARYLSTHQPLFLTIVPFCPACSGIPFSPFDSTKPAELFPACSPAILRVAAIATCARHANRQSAGQRKSSLDGWGREWHEGNREEVTSGAD